MRTCLPSRTFFLAALTLGACSGPPPSELGAGCSVPADCESDLCQSVEGSLGAICTETCTTAGASCSGGGLVCGREGVCIPPCSAGSDRGDGADRELCVDGLFAACSGMDAASVCESCGCEPFGGGVCIAGEGCVEPLADGETCTEDVRCSSGLCYRAEGVCGAPRPMGEACTVDAECESLNCGNDGDVSVAGVCMQPLGTVCTTGSSTCTRCIQSFGGIGNEGICSRQGCAPETHNHCPSTRDRFWSCEPTTEGGHFCFETCPLGDDGLGYNCFGSTNFCRNGFCS